MRLTIVLNRELIKRSPIFLALDNRSILLVLRRLTPLTLSPETVALRQGQPNKAMYFIARGLLFVLKDEKVVGSLVDHDCFGEETMMTDAVPDHSVVTKSFVAVMALSRDDFYAACPDLLENQNLQSAAKARKWEKTKKGLKAVCDKPKGLNWGGVLRGSGRRLLEEQSKAEEQSKGNGASRRTSDPDLASGPSKQGRRRLSLSAFQRHKTGAGDACLEA